MAVESSPASIRRARSTSCAALRSGTLPISLRYIRTMSFVGARRRSTSIRTCVAASVSSPGTSMTSMPSVVRCSWIWVRNSSTCSGVKSSTGTASRRSSDVTNPRSRPRATICSFTSSIPNGSRAAAGSLTRFPSRSRARPPQCTERFARRPGRGTTVARSRKLAVQSLPDATQFAVHLGEFSEEVVPPRIDRGIELLQPHAHLIAPRLQQELVEPREHTVRILGGVVALERRDLTRESRIRTGDDRRDVAVGVAQCHEQTPVRGGAEVVLGQAHHGVPVGIGVRGEEFQHLPLHAFLGGAALDRLRDLRRSSPEPSLQGLEYARLRDTGEVGE